MNKSALIKIAGILVVSFLVITVATFFLYPYINEQKYDQIQAEREERYPSDELEGGVDNDELTPLDPEFFGSENAGRMVTAGGDTLMVADSSAFVMTIDSLTAANDSLHAELQSVMEALANLEEALLATGADEAAIAQVREGNQDVEFIAAAQEPREEFSERIKSLLNLDEEDLTPIANHMTQEELVRIYTNSGNLQREKLLRSLSSERAAKLMQEIML